MGGDGNKFKRYKPRDVDEVVAYIGRGYGDNFRVEEVRVRIDKNFERLLSEAEITIDGVKYPVCYVLDDGTVKIFDNELLEWIRYEYFGTLYLDKELTKRDVVITAHKLIEEKGVDTAKKGWMAELTDKVVGDEPDWNRIWLIVPEELSDEWEKLSVIGEILGGFVSDYVCDVTVNGKPAKVYKVSLAEIETESTVGSPIGYYGSIEIDDNGRVVADDGWITGWLVKDIDVDILKRFIREIVREIVYYDIEEQERRGGQIIDISYSELEELRRGYGVRYVGREGTERERTVRDYVEHWGMTVYRTPDGRYYMTLDEWNEYLRRRTLDEWERYLRRRRERFGGRRREREETERREERHEIDAVSKGTDGKKKGEVEKENDNGEKDKVEYEVLVGDEEIEEEKPKKEAEEVEGRREERPEERQERERRGGQIIDISYSDLRELRRRYGVRYVGREGTERERTIRNYVERWGVTVYRTPDGRCYVTLDEWYDYLWRRYGVGRREREERRRGEGATSGDFDVDVLRWVVNAGFSSMSIAHALGRILGMDRGEARNFVDGLGSDGLRVLTNSLRRIVRGEGTDEDVNNVIAVVRRYAEETGREEIVSRLTDFLNRLTGGRIREERREREERPEERQERERRGGQIVYIDYSELEELRRRYGVRWVGREGTERERTVRNYVEYWGMTVYRTPNGRYYVTLDEWERYLRRRRERFGGRRREREERERREERHEEERRDGKS